MSGDRKIGGLAPVSALSRMRGSGSNTPAPEASDTAPASEPTPAVAAPATPAPTSAAQSPAEAATPAPAPITPAKPRTAAKRAPRAASARPAATKEQQGIYMPSDLRARAHATFLATQYQEGDVNFSDFANAAIQREIERREQEHNGGEPFVAGPARVRSGRPLGS